MNPSKKIAEIHDEIDNCTKCPLHKTRNNAVPGEGPVDARVMFVGEAPGASEDELGRPFVGRSGQLLRKMIEEVGISCEEVFITSVLKSRPPGNRTPRTSEVNACMPFLDRQIAVIKPDVIVLLGGVAISSLIGPRRVGEAHGKFIEAGDRKYFMTYHPAAALRTEKWMDAMRQDFQILKREIS